LRVLFLFEFVNFFQHALLKAVHGLAALCVPALVGAKYEIPFVVTGFCSWHCAEIHSIPTITAMTAHDASTFVSVLIALLL